MQLIEIFKPGTFRAMDGTEVAFSEADLLATAQAYDPKLFQAPLVVGHPKLQDPAYGLVKRLEFAEGRLRAEPDQVEPAFAELVNRRRFTSVSASLYAKDSPDNPKPGVFYLRHVGFLGAAPPSLKGLKPPVISFKEAERGILTIEFGENRPVLDESRLRQLMDWLGSFFRFDAGSPPPFSAPTPTTVGFSESTKKEEPMSAKPGDGQATDPTKTKEFAEQQAALDKQKAEQEQRQKDLDARERKIADDQAAARRLEFTEFIGGLIKEGKVLPCHKDGLVDLMMAVPAGRTFEFAEGDKKTQKATIDVLKNFLSTGPARIEFGEVAGGEGQTGSQDPVDIARRAQAYQDDQAKKGNELSFSECVKHVTKGGK